MKMMSICAALAAALIHLPSAAEAGSFSPAKTRGPSPVTYYLAAPEGSPRPLVVVLQGSGCEPVFVEGKDGLMATAGQDVVEALAANRFAVMIVEKPFIAGKAADSGPAGEVSDGCPLPFRRAHTLENWSAAVGRAVAHARQSGAVDRTAPVSLIGLSEGAIVAARLASMRPEIGRVAFISGFGCDQWSDMLVRARLDAMAGEGSIDEKISRSREAVAAVEAGFATIARDPRNPNAFFEGQTHLFWSTFGKACPASDLANAKADVVVYYGTEDEAVDANGVEAITAARLAAGKPIRVERVYGGGHMLNTSADDPYGNIVAAFAGVLDWMAEDK